MIKDINPTAAVVRSCIYARGRDAVKLTIVLASIAALTVLAPEIGSAQSVDNKGRPSSIIYGGQMVGSEQKQAPSKAPLPPGYAYGADGRIGFVGSNDPDHMALPNSGGGAKPQPNEDRRTGFPVGVPISK